MSKCVICGKPIKGSGNIGPECESKKRSVSEKYAYARESIISNQGEDVKLSARHLRNEYSSYDEINKSGLSEKLIIRDKLLKSHPVKYPEVTNKNALKVFIIERALKKFPNKPFSVEKIPGKDSIFACVYKNKINYIDRDKARCDLRTATNRSYDSGARTIELNVDELNEGARKHYYETYNKLKDKAEELANKEDVDYKNALEEFKSFSKEVTEGITDGTSAGYFNKQNLQEFYMNSLETRFRGNNLNKDILNLGKSANLEDNVQRYILGHKYAVSELSEEEIGSKISDKVRGYLGGESISDTSGTARSKFKMANLYVNSSERIGESTKRDTAQKQLDFITKECGFRAVQWGNSVNDQERISHLKWFTESIEDLSDVLDLQSREVSFNGNLAVAFGARGSGDALAHYEPSNDIINLTRKNGPGALAHEWFHGLENHWRRKNSHPVKTTILSKKTSDPEVNIAIDNIKTKLNKISKRWQQTDTFKALPKSKKEYFLAYNEVFARVGEVYVDKLLRDKKRVNTYLSGSISEDLWPTKQEIEEMESDLKILVRYMAKN